MSFLLFIRQVILNNLQLYLWLQLILLLINLMKRHNLSSCYERLWRRQEQQQAQATWIYQLFIADWSCHSEWLIAAIMTVTNIVVDEFDENTQFKVVGVEVWWITLWRWPTEIRLVVPWYHWYHYYYSHSTMNVRMMREVGVVVAQNVVKTDPSKPVFTTRRC